MISRSSTKNIGVVDSLRVRFCILSTSPASPASSASAPAKDADDASGAGDVAHAGEGTSGNEGKCMEMNDMK